MNGAGDPGRVCTLGRMVGLDDVLVRELTEHARRDAPNEVCGIVAAVDGRPVKVFPMANADASPSTYRLDPREQLAVFDEMDRSGWELFAIYHSHPRTAAYPSSMDVRHAFYPDARYVIVSLADPETPEVRAFRIVEGTVTEEPIALAAVEAV